VTKSRPDPVPVPTLLFLPNSSFSPPPPPPTSNLPLPPTSSTTTRPISDCIIVSSWLVFYVACICLCPRSRVPHLRSFLAFDTTSLTATFSPYGKKGVIITQATPTPHGNSRRASPEFTTIFAGPFPRHCYTVR